MFNFSLHCCRIELFNVLYRRVLCRQRINDDQLTVVSLQALAKVYKRYHEEIGQFSDMAYILQLLDRVCIECKLSSTCVWHWHLANMAQHYHLFYLTSCYALNN